MSALSETRRARRVGHKGADAIEPGNTLASFDVALKLGVDMIEFDVLPEDRHDPLGSRLVLAHDYKDAARRSPITLDEALAHLASEPFAAIDFDIDLKLPGYEARVVDAVREHGLLERAMTSTMEWESLAAVQAAEPSFRVGWTVPHVTSDPFRSPLTMIPALIAIVALRILLPGRCARALRAARCQAVMAHWRVVTPRMVAAVLDAGGELYVWTVDDAERIAALEQLGVSGIITNDPRLFRP